MVTIIQLTVVMTKSSAVLKCTRQSVTAVFKLSQTGYADHRFFAWALPTHAHTL